MSLLSSLIYGQNSFFTLGYKSVITCVDRSASSFLLPQSCRPYARRALIPRNSKHQTTNGQRPQISPRQSALFNLQPAVPTKVLVAVYLFTVQLELNRRNLAQSIARYLLIQIPSERPGTFYKSSGTPPLYIPRLLLPFSRSPFLSSYYSRLYTPCLPGVRLAVLLPHLCVSGAAWNT